MERIKIAAFHNIIADGGGKRSFYELVKFLSKNHRVDFYTITGTETGFCNVTDIAANTYIIKYRERYFNKRPFSYLNLFIAFLNLFRINKVFRKIAFIIDKNDYDIVFISNYHNTLLPSLTKYLNTPKVFYCHEPNRLVYEPALYHFEKIIGLRKKISRLVFGYLRKLYNYILKISDLIYIRHTDLVLCNSYYTKEYIKRVYGIAAKVNYLGVDIKKFKPLDIPKENLVVSIGHLEPRKGHDFIISAISKIPDNLRPKLAIVHPSVSNSYKLYLEDLANRHKIELLFFERLSDTEMVVLYNRAKITLCAYIREPFGLVSLESMACQTPVVIIEEGGLKEAIVNNVTGIATKRDIDEFSKAIEYLLTNEEYRRKMGQEARKKILENWTWEKSGQELEKNLSSVLKK